MQKLLLVSLVLGASLHCFGAEMMPSETYPDYKCQKEVQKELTTLFGANTPHWERTADPSFDTQAFRSPTAKTGEWYELQIVEKGQPKLFMYSTAKISEWNWNSKCAMTNKKSHGFEFFKMAKNAKAETFGDSDLEKMLKEKRTVMIYVWSPRMVYSVTEFTRVRALAEKRKMEFVPVLDPAVDATEARAAMKKAGIDFQLKSASAEREPSSVAMYKRMNSVELYMRNGTLHFPTVFVASNGQMHTRRLIGVLSNEDLNHELDTMMGDLK